MGEEHASLDLGDCWSTISKPSLFAIGWKLWLKKPHTRGESNDDLERHFIQAARQLGPVLMPHHFLAGPATPPLLVLQFLSSNIFLVARKNVLFRIKQRKNPPLWEPSLSAPRARCDLRFRCEKNFGIAIVRRGDPSLGDPPYSSLFSSHRSWALKDLKVLCLKFYCRMVCWSSRQVLCF